MFSTLLFFGMLHLLSSGACNRINKFQTTKHAGKPAWDPEKERVLPVTGHYRSIPENFVSQYAMVMTVNSCLKKLGM